MELHQLRYFVAVADLSSFTRAAERCCVAQPSLSQQIIKLEAELKQPLFERLGRTVKLTEAGEALYAQAVQILAAVDEIHERVSAATDPGVGKVRLGAIPTVAPYLLPPILKAFARRYPAATLMLHEDLTEATLKACREGELDVGIIAGPAADDLITSEVLFTEELLVALPKRHRFEKQRRLAWGDLAGEPFILMNEVHCLGQQVVGFCQQQGCQPSIRCQSVQLSTIQELVALGHGISLVPAMACHTDRGKRLVYRSIADAPPTRAITLIWRHDRFQAPIVRAFIEMLREGSAGMR